MGQPAVIALRNLSRASTNGWFPGRSGFTYILQKVIAVPIPSAKELDLLARCLGPWVAISERGVKAKCHDAESQEDDGAGGAYPLAGLETKAWNTRGDKVICLAEGQDGEVERWKVVVQEELALHQEEREVVEGPAEDEGADLVVETLKWDRVEILVAALPSQKSNTLENGEDGDGDGGGPPDDRVANQVDLAVLLAPEVDTAAENWPGLWAGIPGVGVEESSIGGPHDLLELPELA